MHLIKETQVGEKSVISEKWLQAITHFSRGRARGGGREHAAVCCWWCLTIAAIKKKKGKWTLRMWLGPSVILSLIISRGQIFNFVLLWFGKKKKVSEWFPIQPGKQSIVSFGKESSFDVGKKGALLKPLFYRRQKLHKVAQSCCLNFPCYANLEPLSYNNLSKKAPTVPLWNFLTILCLL